MRINEKSKGIGCMTGGLLPSEIRFREFSVAKYLRDATGDDHIIATPPHLGFLKEERKTDFP